MNDVHIFDDERHDQWMQVARELNRRVLAEQAPEGIHDWIVERIRNLQPTSDESLVTTWPESFEIYESEMERRIALSKVPPSERRLFNWPWSTWNSIIDPAEGGMLTVLAGPDGVGKTSYAECIAEHWARNAYHVVFVHFELNKIIMFDRRAARHTAIARRRLKLAGDLDDEDLYKLEQYKRRLLAWPGDITYLHTPGKSFEIVLRELDKCKADGLCDAVIIDYLEKAAPSSAQLKAYGANIFAREASDVELIKSWSESREVPTVMLSQFNKSGKHAGFSDLDRTAIRGAGEKTEKANVVVLLHPGKSPDPDIRYTGIVNVRVDKNTLGPTGSFQQFFDGPTYSVGDVARG